MYLYPYGGRLIGAEATGYAPRIEPLPLAGAVALARSVGRSLRELEATASRLGRGISAPAP